MVNIGFVSYDIAVLVSSVMELHVAFFFRLVIVQNLGAVFAVISAKCTSSFLFYATIMRIRQYKTV